MNSLTKVKLQCKNLHQYLCNLPPAMLEALYEHPATCMVVFRELPELAKYYVMRILFVDQPVTKAAVSSWVTCDAKQVEWFEGQALCHVQCSSLAGLCQSLHHLFLWATKFTNVYNLIYCYAEVMRNNHEESVKVLCDLRVWIENALQGSISSTFSLSNTFRRNLQKALVGGGDSWSSTAHLGPDKHVKDCDALDKYAEERWDALLHYLVGSKTSAPISQDLKDITLQAGLMRNDEEAGRKFSVITAKGFQFLLLDGTSQVWYFVLEYLNWVRDRGMNLVPILRFLFELSFSTPGKDLPADGRDEQVLTCLQTFREMGLVMQRKRKSRRFYPTRLAVNLANGVNDSTGSTNRKQGYIIAETNYRVYAYTESELQYAILSLFCEMIYRFPNVCVLQLTRESVQTAVVNGITADQILHFIKANAHPDMLQNDPIIAPTLADQIRLWAMERDRLTFQDGVLYNQFLAQHDFEVLRDYAKELGALIWDNADKRYMVVTREGHDHVKKYWKRYKKESETKS